MRSEMLGAAWTKAAPRLQRMPPPALLASLYGVLIVLGAAALMLPAATVKEISWSDALFTATSAVTVTGLAVIDPGNDMTLLGQAILAVLVQLGGLGLMTFAVAILGLLGMQVGLTGHQFLREELKQDTLHQLLPLVQTILRVVLVCEGLGALVLLLAFVPDHGFWMGAWYAVFHSISAFNNAGITILPTGLVPYATDPVVNLMIPLLFITGGIGYVVLRDVFGKRGRQGWTLHTRIMLAGTAMLIVTGVLGFAALEWTNPATLGQFDTAAERLVVSWFQGVTTRTAGFNTVNIAALHDDTSLMFISMMLIGGGPASTAGGIKVTTFVVMLLATVAFFRRRTQLHAFGRSIGLDQVMKVMALVALSVVLCFVGVFLLTVSHDGEFLDVTFEVASAFGTVGLSRGFTGELGEFGRVVVEVLMFLGRVGPLTLGFFLATQSAPRVRYPEGQIHLG